MSSTLRILPAAAADDDDGDDSIKKIGLTSRSRLGLIHFVLNEVRVSSLIMIASSGYNEQKLAGSMETIPCDKFQCQW